MENLMKTFMFSQDCPFIPQLIQEIPNFKSWVNGYLNNGSNILVSHTKMHLFRFFVDEVWWLVMQYKVSPIDVLWSPKDGLAIWLWMEDGTRQPKLWVGVSNLVPFHLIWGNDKLKACEKERFISSEISKYIKFKKLGMFKDNSYSKVMGHYVKYWEKILELLLKPIPRQSSILLEGLWPSSNWRINYECASIPTVVDVDPEDHVIPPYYGPRNMHPFF